MSHKLAKAHENFVTDLTDSQLQGFPRMSRSNLVSNKDMRLDMQGVYSANRANLCINTPTDTMAAYRFRRRSVLQPSNPGEPQCNIDTNQEGRRCKITNYLNSVIIDEQHC